MEGITLAALEEELAANLENQEVERLVRKSVEEMEHYKRVDRRLIDTLELNGVAAWMCKDHSTTKLCVRKFTSNRRALDLRDYGNPLTWDAIKRELTMYSFKEDEQNIRDKIASHAQDLEILAEVAAFIKTKNTKNFDMWRITRDIQHVIRNSQPRTV